MPVIALLYTLLMEEVDCGLLLFVDLYLWSFGYQEVDSLLGLHIIHLEKEGRECKCYVGIKACMNVCK